MNGRIIQRFFDNLLAGDPVAVGIVSVLVLAALAFVVVWLRASRELRREDEARRRKYGGGKKR
jgi:hypothetical protein